MKREAYGFLKYSLKRGISLIVVVVIAVYITILIANMGGYVDNIIKSEVRFRIGVQVNQNPAYKGLPPREKGKLIEKLYQQEIKRMGLDTPFILRSYKYLAQALTLDLGRALYLTSDTGSRSVKIINPNTGEAVTTDGISGEMLKHIHSEIMWVLDDKKYLCEACKVLHPERFNYVVNKNKSKFKSPEQVIEEAVKTCDICDIHGFMVEKPTVSRKSTVEFGWALGIPDVYRDIHLHARHSTQTQAIEEVLEPGEWGNHKCSTKGCDTDPNESRLLKINGKWYCEAHAPTAQMIYHRSMMPSYHRRLL